MTSAPRKSPARRVQVICCSAIRVAVRTALSCAPRGVSKARATTDSAVAASCAPAILSAAAEVRRPYEVGTVTAKLWSGVSNDCPAPLDRLLRATATPMTMATTAPRAGSRPRRWGLDAGELALDIGADPALGDER